MGPREADPGQAETGHAETGHAETGHAETGHAETGHAETGGAETGGAETGGAETGHAETAGDFGGLQRFGRNPGWIVTGIAGLCYGLLVAFVPLGEPARTNLIMIGALVVAALFIASFLGAFVIWFFRRALGMYDAPGDPRK